MSGNPTTFGSRTEFLPGEEFGQSDIKYQRYGGCFVTTRKGFFCGLCVATLCVVVGLLVWHYKPCRAYDDGTNEYELADNFINSLRESASDPHTENDKLVNKLPTKIVPSYYRLRIQPYLDEGPKKFTFDGQVAIVFQVKDKSRKFSLNVRNLLISESTVILTYSTTSRIKPLKSESQIAENFNSTASTTSENSVETSTTSNQSDNGTSIQSTTVNSDSEITTTSAPKLNPFANSTGDIADISLTTILPEEVRNDINYTIFPLTAGTPSSTTSSSIDTSVTTSTSAPEVSSTSTVSTSTVSSTSAPSPFTTSTQPSVYQVAQKITVQPMQHEYDKEKDIYTITFDRKLEKGINYTLEIQFTGNISDGPGGFLRSSYKKENKTIWLASTLLYPNYARMVFPCFDEPNFKARFEISIARQTNMVALSNMPLKDTVEFDKSRGWVWDHFEITPLMPTHLVAFAVCDFIPKKAVSSASLPVINTWGHTKTSNKAKYILNVTPKIMASYNTYFSYNYVLPKIDLVAIPNYPVKAMGNWGLVFVREGVILVDEQSQNCEKKYLLETVAHELARQWFGNLFSIKSWKDLWLLESLCTYAQYIGMHAGEPTWGIVNEFQMLDALDVMDVDSMNVFPELSKAVQKSPHLNDELMTFVNKKGSALIRMLNVSLTESMFRTGIQKFIDDWKYKRFEQANLWDELTDIAKNSSSGIKVKEVIDTWVNHKGYPVIAVNRNYEDGSISVKQEKFTETNSTDDKGNVWSVPLYYITSDKSANNSAVWLTDSAPKVIEESFEQINDSWVLFNSDQSALCRINYDVNNWNRLLKLLQDNPETLSPMSRAQILDDAFHLARNGLLNYTVAFDLTLYLKDKEKHYLPWIAALRNFEYLDLVLSKTPNYGDFLDYLMKLVNPMYRHLGVHPRDEDNYSTITLRKTIIRWACKLNNKNCREWAYSQYLTWANFTDPDNVNQVEKDLRSTMYCVGVQMRGRSAWDFLWERYQAVKGNYFDAFALITGMGCARDTWILIRYLHRAVEEKAMYNSVAMWESMNNEYSTHVAFEFLRNNWSSVKSAYGRLDIAFQRILNIILSQLSTKNELDELIRFFSTRQSDLKNFASDFASIIEKLKIKIEWKKNYLSTVDNWLRAQKE